MTMINKQELLEWLYEERCNAQRQLDVREVGDSNWYEYRGRTAAFSYVIHYVNSMPDDEPLQAEPKFKVGDRVKILFGTHQGCIGTIIDIADDEPAIMIQFGEGRTTWRNTATIELIKDEPTPSAKDIKVKFKLTGAEAFVESAKQLIEALEALEVKIDDERDTDTAD